MGGQNKCRPPSRALILLVVLIASLIGYLYLAHVTAPNNDVVAVPVHRIPAYHIIKADEFTTKVLDNNTLPSNAIHDISPYVNKSDYYCTLEPLEAEKPLLNDTLFNLQNLTEMDQIVVGIPATLATSLGGKLERGDVTDLIVPSVEGPWEIRNVQILDIIGNTSDNASAEFTIVVVLPRTSALRLINETDGNKAVSIRALEM